MSGKLFLVGTPIGNLQDMTFRAVETLKNVDIIACEDTRHTMQLLQKFDIKKPLISYHQHKEQQASEQIIELLVSGKDIALVSDAGMPCISDPGSILVQKLLDKDLSYTVIPGASAVVSAVALTGLSSDFCFLGFLPPKNKDRKDIVAMYKNVSGSLVFYSAPHDINKDLEFLWQNLGEREVFLVKEITKIYETVTKGFLSTLRLENAKGEFVIVVRGHEANQNEVSDEDIKEALDSYIKGGMDKKTAIKTVVNQLEVAKNRVYEIAIKSIT